MALFLFKTSTCALRCWRKIHLWRFHFAFANYCFTVSVKICGILKSSVAECEHKMGKTLVLVIFSIFSNMEYIHVNTVLSRAWEKWEELLTQWQHWYGTLGNSRCCSEGQQDPVWLMTVWILINMLIIPSDLSFPGLLVVPVPLAFLSAISACDVLCGNCTLLDTPRAALIECHGLCGRGSRFIHVLIPVITWSSLLLYPSLFSCYTWFVCSSMASSPSTGAKQPFPACRLQTGCAPSEGVCNHPWVNCTKHSWCLRQQGLSRLDFWV